MKQKSLLVPEGTKRIIRHQFKNLELEEIVLPESLEWIGAHCFRNSKIRRLVLPSSVVRIDFGAFSACDNLEEVVLPKGIQKIGPLAFSECENLKNVRNLPTHNFGRRAFYEYRLSQHCCPYCGALLGDTGQCSAQCDNPYNWTGSLRLYKGLFWWDGQQLITVKVHVCQTGKPSYSNWFFNKRDHLGSHKEEWGLLRKSGNPAVKGHPLYDEYPRGLVEIDDFKARVFLHPDLDNPKIRNIIMNEFGLSKELQGLKSIRFIVDYS